MRAHVLLVPSLALLAGCPVGSDPEPTVTWTDVAPLVEAHCAECHREGGVGPFRADTYEDASAWAGAMASAVADRSMPPFLVKDDGTCGTYEDGHWLSDAEIDLFATWAAEGAAEGEGATVTPPEPARLTGAAVDTTTPDFLPEIVGGQNAEFDEYRCFPAEIPGGASGFLTGYEVLPGNPAIVHHVLGYAVKLDGESDQAGKTNAERMAELEAEDPDRDGWPCFTEAGSGVAVDFEVVAWAPGQGPVEYPDGVGLAIPEGSVMVYQVHYNLADPATVGTRDQTTVRLRIEEEVDRQAYMTLPDGFLGGLTDLGSLPPDEEEVTIRFDLPINWLTGGLPIELELLGVMPHMHERGREMRVRLRHPDDAQTCVAEVEAWSFEWQRLYMYETPIQVSSNDVLEVECTYSTLGDTEPTTPGWGTQNEMCLPGLLAAVAE